MKNLLVAMLFTLVTAPALAATPVLDKYGRDVNNEKFVTPESKFLVLSPSEVRNRGLDIVGLTSRKNTQPFTLGIPYKPGKTSIGSVAHGDVDGDGDIEIVAVSNFYFDEDNDYSVFVFHPTERGLGEPQKVAYDARANRNGLTIKDLNADNIDEIIVGHGSGLTILSSDGTGGFVKQAVDSPASDTLDAFDINLDGQQDVIGLPWRAPANQYFGAGDGSIASQSSLDTQASGYNDQALGDLNGDGFLDYVVMSGQSYATPNFSVHLHNTVDGLQAAQSYFVGERESTSGLGVGDINGDGRDDVILSRGRNSPTHLWVYTQNEEGELEGPSQLPSYDVPETIRVADLDGNGYDDIVVLHGGWTTLGVYLNDAQGYGEEIRVQIPYASHYDPEGLSLVDVNLDGCPELFVIADYNHGVVPVHSNLCPKNITKTVEGTMGAYAWTYYDIDVSGGVIDLSLAFSGRWRDLDLYLYNDAGERVASSAWLDNPETLVFDTNGVGGKYRVGIYNYTRRSTQYTFIYQYTP